MAATAEARELELPESPPLSRRILSELEEPPPTLILILGFELSPEAASFLTRSSTSSWKRICGG